jgi:hypothetical protein
MPNDARLGLVCGVGLVIAVAVIFFRREVPLIALPSGPAAIGKPDNDPVPPAPPPPRAPIIARPTGLTSDPSFSALLPEQQGSIENGTVFHPALRQEGAPPIGMFPQSDTPPAPPR